MIKLPSLFGQRFARVAEISANLATLVAGITVAVFMVHQMNHPPPSVTNTPRTESGWLRGGLAPVVEGVKYAATGQTLLIAASSACHFCQQSIPLYRRLAEKAKQTGRTQVIAVFPDSDSNTDHFVGDNKISVTQIAKANFTAIRVRATPTLLLVDKSGHLLDFWVGVLPPGEEDRLIGKI